MSNTNTFHIIQKKRRNSSKAEQYVILPVSKDVISNKSNKETPKALLFDNVWYPKSLLTYTPEGMLSMPLWWVQKTRKDIIDFGGDVSKVLSPLTLNQLRNSTEETEE